MWLTLDLQFISRDFRSSAQDLSPAPRPSPTASLPHRIRLSLYFAGAHTHAYTGGGGLFYCASFLKFISFLSTYFPPTRDLSTSQPAQSLVEVWWPARGFLGEPPSRYSLPKPTSGTGSHPLLPGSTRDRAAPREEAPSRREAQSLAQIPTTTTTTSLYPLAQSSGACRADLAAHRGC